MRFITQRQGLTLFGYRMCKEIFENYLGIVLFQEINLFCRYEMKGFVRKEKVNEITDSIFSLSNLLQ